MQSFQSASLITAIKTPYTEQGEIDIDTYDYLVQQQISAGVDGIIVGGTTGEGQLLDWEEHLMLIAHSANKFGEQLLIVGNVGSNNTREAVKAAQYGFASGMHAALQINPYYGKSSTDGIFEHLNRSLDVGPAFIYNVPGRTGQDITPDIMVKLAEHENFIGVKECAGNDRINQYEQQGIACWSGNDDECSEGKHQCKSHGVISVTANLVPGLMRQLMDNYEPELNQSLQALMDWLFCEPNPIAINTALMMTKAVNPVFRLPYVPLNAEQRAHGIELMNAIGVAHLVGKSPEQMSDNDFKIII